MGVRLGNLRCVDERADVLLRNILVSAEERPCARDVAFEVHNLRCSRQASGMEGVSSTGANKGACDEAMSARIGFIRGPGGRRDECSGEDACSSRHSVTDYNDETVCCEPSRGVC